jgi:quercetin dioxygenase-like cupin family protein
VLVREWGFFIAMLRFERNATIQEHPGANDAVVMCIDGESWTSVADAKTQIRAGELVHWPKEVPHRLWTESGPMTTPMFELIS